MKIDFDSEEELEEIIWNHYQRTGEVLVDGTTPDNLYRQMVLEPYGIADLVGVSYSEEESSLIVEIYELKKEKITASAIAQAYRYCAAFYNTLHQKDNAPIIDARINVVGTSIDESCFMVSFTSAFYYEATFDPGGGLVFTDRSRGWKKGPGTFGPPVENVLQSLIDAKERCRERQKEEDAEIEAAIDESHNLKAVK